MPGLFFESRDCGNTSLAGFNIDALSAPPLTSHLGRYFVSLTVHRECTGFPEKKRLRSAAGRSLSAA